MFDLVAVLVALGLLMYLAYRGITLLILAPAMALLTGGTPRPSCAARCLSQRTA